MESLRLRSRAWVLIQRGRFKLTPLAEFTQEGANNACNYLGRLFDYCARGCVAAVVPQPRVGLCPHGRRRSRSPRRYHSRSPRTYLDFGGGSCLAPTTVSQRRPASLSARACGSSKVYVVSSGALSSFST